MQMEGYGKLLVRGPKELLSLNPAGARGVAGTSETLCFIGRGRSRARIEVNEE